MKTSAAGLAFIAHWEGEVLKPYKDAAGVWTIGVGHACTSQEDYWRCMRGGEWVDGITHEQAMVLLAGDVGIAEHGVNTQVPDVDNALSQNAFDACVSFAFNCGAGAFGKSSILSFIRTGDLVSAARMFLLYDKCKDPKTGQLVTNAGLFARRCAERDLFLRPDADDNPY